MNVAADAGTDSAFSTIFSRARLRWRLVTVIVVSAVILGLAAAFFVPIKYTAQSQVITGATSVNAAAVPSAAEGGRTLAETYSRVFKSDGVQQALAAKFQSDPSKLASASPIPDSSVVLIEAYGSTPQQAIDIANTSVDALLATTGSLVNDQAAIQQAQNNVQDAYTRLNTAQADIQPGDEDVRNPGALDRKSRVQSAQAEVDAYVGQLNKIIAENGSANGVQRLASGQVTSSNNFRRFEFGGLAGLILGLVASWVFTLRSTAPLSPASVSKHVEAAASTPVNPRSQRQDLSSRVDPPTVRVNQDQNRPNGGFPYYSQRPPGTSSQSRGTDQTGN